MWPYAEEAIAYLQEIVGKNNNLFSIMGISTSAISMDI
jgi:hypothetical protein